MNYMDKRMLFSFIGIAVLNAIAILYVDIQFPESDLLAFLLVGLFEIVVVFAVFSFTDHLIPKPPVAELNLGDKFTELWKSSSFWVFLLLTVSAISEVFFGYTITEGEAKEIVNLDWTNLIQAATGIFMLVMRKENGFNLLTPIK